MRWMAVRGRQAMWNLEVDMMHSRNTQGGAQKAHGAHRNGKRRLCVTVAAVLLAVVLAGGAAWWFLGERGPGAGDRGKGKAKSAEAAKKPKVIKEAKPAAAPKRRPVEVPPRAEAKPKVYEALPGESQEMARMRNEEPSRYAAVTNRAAQRAAALEKMAREPVKGIVEQVLMLATPPSKGTPVPPLPIAAVVDEEFEREAKAMLNRVVEAEEHDDEMSLEVKVRLLKLREEWAKAESEGWTFADFLQAKQTKANEDEGLLNEAATLDGENFNNAKLSDEQYLDLRSKIDNLLKVQGFDGLPPLEAETESQMEEADAAAAAATNAPSRK